jgi:hypothetical protein
MFSCSARPIAEAWASLQLLDRWTDGVYPDAIHRVIQGHRFCQRDQGSLHRDIRLHGSSDG